MAGSKGMRNAGIKITIDGEKEFNARIKTIRAETKAFEKELKLVEAQFAGQRNTLEALSKEYKANANILKSLGNEHKELISRGQRIQKQLDEQIEAHKRHAYVLEYEKKILEVYGKTFGENSQKYKDQKRAVEEAQVAYNNSGAAIDDLNRRYAKNTSALKDNEIKAAGLENRNKQVRAGLDDMEKSGKNTTNMFDKMGKTMGQTAEETEKLRNQLQTHQLIEYAREGAQAIVDMFEKVAEKIKECIQSYYDLETAVISVSKTVPNLSDAEAEEMITSLVGTLPLSRDEIAQVLSKGGQYGISKENLTSFAQAMSALASATNIGVSDLSMVAQLASILHTADADYMRMASALTDLGNKTRTTEKDTVHMAQTIAATANIVGLSQAEVLGLANSLSAFGGMARGSGTAMNRFLSSIHEAVVGGGEELDQFAKIAGTTSDQFKRAFEQDAMGAILSVLKGMHDVVESGGNIYAVFDNLNIGNSIDKQNLKNLAVGYDELVRTLGIAETAWGENVALMTEFNKAVDTNASQVTLFKNSLDNLQATLGKLYNEDIGIPKLRTILTELINEWNDSLNNPNSFLKDPFGIKGWFDNSGLSSFFDNAKNTLSLINPLKQLFNQLGISENPILDAINDWIKEIERRANYRKYDFSGSEDYFSQLAHSYVDEAKTTFRDVLSGADSPASMMAEQWATDVNAGVIELKMETDEITKTALITEESIRNSLESIYDSMDKFSAKSQISLKDWVKNLEANAEAMKKYSDNLAIVMEDDRISDGVKEFIRTHGMEETYNIVGDLAKGNNDKLVEELNEAFAGWGEQLDESSDTITESITGLLDASIGAMEEYGMKDKTTEIGLGAVEGLAAGLDDNVDLITNAAIATAKALEDGVRDTLQINSPSKVMEGLGEYAVEGFVNGLKAKESDVINQARLLAEKAALTYNVTLGMLIGQVSASYTVNGKDYTNVLNEIRKNTGRKNTVVVNSGGRTSQSTTNDLERALVKGMLY